MLGAVGDGPASHETREDGGGQARGSSGAGKAQPTGTIPAFRTGCSHEVLLPGQLRPKGELVLE